MGRSSSVIASPEGAKQSNRSDCFVAALLAMTVAALAMVFLSASAAMAADDEMSAYEAAQKARSAHELASSDMIYQQEEWKALYYQNIQIIQLLKEIHESLRIQNERAAKIDQKTMKEELQ